MVILGDSLSAGTGAAKGEGFVDLLQQRLGVEIVNRGIPGNTTAQGLARLDKDVLSLKPSLVIVELGGNDAAACRDNAFADGLCGGEIAHADTIDLPFRDLR